jgi:hypothetical protein
MNLVQSGSHIRCHDVQGSGFITTALTREPSLTTPSCQALIPSRPTGRRSSPNGLEHPYRTSRPISSSPAPVARLGKGTRPPCLVPQNAGKAGKTNLLVEASFGLLLCDGGSPGVYPGKVRTSRPNSSSPAPVARGRIWLYRSKPVGKQPSPVPSVKPFILDSPLASCGLSRMRQQYPVTCIL